MTLRILVVCTANVCRSPMAAALLGHHCAEYGIDAHVRSAGTHAGIVRGDPETVEVMAERGFDLFGHAPRLLTRAIVSDDGADLIVTMTRSHLRDVAMMGFGVFNRSFTAKELVRRISDMTSASVDASQLDIAGWRAALGVGRLARDLVGDDPSDDVDDPFGQSVAVHHATADELDGLMSMIAASLAAWRVRHTGAQ